MRILILLISILLIGCTDLPTAPGTGYTPTLYNVVQVITGYGDPVTISIDRQSVSVNLDQEKAYTNSYSNAQFQAPVAKTIYSDGSSSARVQMVLYTNGVLYYSNEAIGTNWLIEKIIN